MDSCKKPRILYQTPVHGNVQPPSTTMRTPVAPASSTQTGDILDYLKGRGGRIKELEDAVTEQRTAKEQLASQLQHAEQQVRSLERRLQTASMGGDRMPGHSSVYVAELEKVVKDQMQRVLELEQALAVAREQLASTQVNARNTQSELIAARDTALKAAAQSNLSVAKLQQDIALLHGEHAEKLARAERAVKMEEARAAAQAQVHQTTCAALHDAEERLVQRDAQMAALLKRLPAAAAASCDTSQLHERLRTLEAALAHAAAERAGLVEREELEEVREKLAAAAKRETAARVAAEAAAERAAIAETRVRRLEAEADSLARDVAGMQEKLGRGQFDSKSSTRVLHLRMNPETEYHKQAAQGQAGLLQAQVDALTASLAQAQAALSTMEERAVAAESLASFAGGASHDPSTQGGSPAAPSAAGTSDLMTQLATRDADLAMHRHKLAEADKASARLRAVFKERTVAFREALYLLFGYRVDMASEATTASAAANAVTTFSLRPQHADNPEDLLVFRYTPEEGMQLVPTPFTTTRLAREVDTFVRRFKCIPALTANLTMESFQKQTQC